MRIATLNIWNSVTDWDQRLTAIACELDKLEPTVVAIQEAPKFGRPGVALVEFLGHRAGFQHAAHLEYPDPHNLEERQEGLAFMSRLPMKATQTHWGNGSGNENNWAASVLVDWHGASLRATNVHLDWRSAESRAKHMQIIVEELNNEADVDYDVLCGDFNDADDSAVASFLTGPEPPNDMNARWRDLPKEFHLARGGTPPPTVNFSSSPRAAEMACEEPKRFDRIYLRTRKRRDEAVVADAGVFANTLSGNLAATPSDHLGVFVDLKIRGC